MTSEDETPPDPKPLYCHRHDRKGICLLCMEEEPTQPSARGPVVWWGALQRCLEDEARYDHWRYPGDGGAMLRMVRDWMDKIERGDWTMHDRKREQSK